MKNQPTDSKQPLYGKARGVESPAKAPTPHYINSIC